MRRYLVDALDLRDDDVYWNAADPGWAYGLYYGVLAPLALGAPASCCTPGSPPPLTWRLLRDLRRHQPRGRADRLPGPAPAAGRVPRGAPALRLVGRGAADARRHRAGRASDLGIAVRDHYGQTELGMLVGNAWRPDLAGTVVPGSMGHPLPGWTCAVLADDRDELAPADDGRPPRRRHRRSPLMWFPGYADAPERTAERYTADGRWYLTGDAASQAADGRLASPPATTT